MEGKFCAHAHDHSEFCCEKRKGETRADESRLFNASVALHFVIAKKETTNEPCAFFSLQFCTDFVIEHAIVRREANVFEKNREGFEI